MIIEQIQNQYSDNIFSLDFKDKLIYSDEVHLEGMTNLQKWIMYDAYQKHLIKDADVVIKEDKYIMDILNWDGKWIDAMFSMRQLLNTLLKTIELEVNTAELLEEPKEILDIINGKILFSKLKEMGIEHPRAWVKKFSKEMEKFSRNVHTIGNYMPCPDGTYNGVKGFTGHWHYNDRIDLLYSDLLNPVAINSKGELIIPEEKRVIWLKWFEENKSKLCLDNILHNEELKRKLERLSCIKKRKFTNEQMQYLPEYLATVNALIRDRTLRLESKVNDYIEEQLTVYYEEVLEEFPAEAIFMYVASFDKGYIQVLPEYEEKYKQAFDILGLHRYENEMAIDKCVGDKWFEGYIEYAYLPLYECHISVEKTDELDLLGLGHRIERAAYNAFAKAKLIKF